MWVGWGEGGLLRWECVRWVFMTNAITSRPQIAHGMRLPGSCEQCAVPFPQNAERELTCSPRSSLFCSSRPDTSISDARASAYTPKQRRAQKAHLQPPQQLVLQQPPRHLLRRLPPHVGDHAVELLRGQVRLQPLHQLVTNVQQALRGLGRWGLGVVGD